MPIPRTPNSAARPGVNPWLLAVVVSLATFMEVLDTSIANVALSHIAGSLGASQNQATWVLTSYLAANAIIIPISGWLSSTMGRKRFYMTCVALFTVSSLLCGIAPSLGLLLVFRVFQGAGGGGLAPSEQSMLADTFPGKYFGMAFAVYGIAVVVAPAIGPTLGGWITDNYSWRWIFFMNIPVGLVSLVLTQRMVQDADAGAGDRPLAVAAPDSPGAPRARSGRSLDRASRPGRPRVDAMGFAFVVLAFGCLQVVLDKGQEAGWFDSPFICMVAAITVASLIGLVLWETLVAKDPVVDVPLMANGALATSMVLQFVVGFILSSTTVLLPMFSQQLLGYNATQAGMVLMPGGLMLMVMMPVAGQLVRRVQPKYLMAAGLGVLTVSLVIMSGFTTQVTFGQVMAARLVQCLGLPLFFIPLNTIAYGNLPPGKSNNASAMMNLMRNLGGSIGIALAVTMITRRSQVHQAYLAASASRFRQPFVQHMNALGGFTRKNLAGFYGTVQVQAAMLSYLDVFRVLTVACMVVIAMVLLLRRTRRSDGPVLTH